MSLHRSYVAGEAARPASTYLPYDAQQSDLPVASGTTEKLQRSLKHQLMRKTPEAVSRNRSVVSSPAYPPKSSLDTTRGTRSSSTDVKGWPSALPRSVSKPYQARLEVLPSSESPPPWSAPLGASRIPVPASSPNETVLRSGSAQKVLRRRAPSVEQYVSNLDRSRPHPKLRIDPRGHPTANQSSKLLKEGFHDSQPNAMLGTAPSELIATSTMLPKRRSGELPPALIPELKALGAASTPSNGTATSTPQVPFVGSPSTQCSGSTGPWSSRDTTPTSMSSCSPGLVQPLRIKATSGLRKPAPLPYNTAENPRSTIKLPPAFETSSSSSPAVPSKNDNDEQLSLQRRQGKQSKMAAAPNPPRPPRKSSVRSKSSQQAGEASDQDPVDPLLENNGKVKGIGDPSKEPVCSVASSAQNPSASESPRRPSRKGTAGLESGSSPIVQSNLSPQSLRGYRRRDSLDATHFGQPPQAVAFGRGTDTDTRNDHLSHAEHLRRPLPQQQVGTVARSTKLPIKRQPPGPAKPVLAVRNHNEQESREAERSAISKLSSRLGIFGRRPKARHEEMSAKDNRDLRRGPAAGTGHEGYGKYAGRGRKNSVGSVNSTRDRSTSTISRPSLRRKNSLASAGGSDFDDFVAQRLQPVIIPGGGGQDVRLDSNVPAVSSPFDRASLDSELNMHMTKQFMPDPPGSVASDFGSISVTSLATDAPSLVTTDLAPTSFSKSIPNQNYPAYTPPLFEGDVPSQSSLVQNDIPVASVDGTPSRHTLRDLKKASKAGRMFKWNLFRRKPSLKKLNRKVDERDSESVQVPVAVSSVSVHKPIPYYALMDSENENDGEDGLRDLFAQVHEPPSPVAGPTSEPPGLGLQQPHRQSLILPSIPTMQQETWAPVSVSSSSPLEGREAQQSELLQPTSYPSAENKRHRLPQVGRIPRVISRRDRQHKPAATSFSRPFQFENLTDVPTGSHSYETSVAETSRPILGIQTDVLPSRPFSTPGSGQPASAPAGPLNIRPLGEFESQSEFLIFPDSGASDDAATSSSNRVLSAVNLRSSAAHRHYTEEDEIWNEYDDLLDHVMSPTGSDPPLSAQPFGPATYSPSGEARHESHLRLEMLQGTGQDTHPVQASSPRLSLPRTSAGAAVNNGLRRSKIASVLQSKPSMSPASPFSISDYSIGHADQKLVGTESRPHFGGVNDVEPGLLSPSIYAHYPTSPKLAGVSHQQSAALLDVVERDREGPAGQSDLRFAALMTSRWLSFGRVLFSPAHEVVEASPGQQILVIDGLGNDDWSFYCAVTYPDAVIYDLKETDVAPSNRWESPQDTWRAPSNYRRIEVPNLAQRFPFPQSYFAAVVFRFPAAMSDTILKMALSECKRVLIPGGHLELSLLDLDIVNMGIITRHAIRDLKSRMIGTDPEVSLKPVSDNIQGILGRKGFENLNRCLVSVPVAGNVATSSGSGSSRSSRDSNSQKGKEFDRASDGGIRQNRKSHESDRQRPRGNFSLSELVSDHSATSDEKITKMVAKVGRWWYTRTYEWAVLAGGDLKRSIWSDKRMLQECKARGSGFRLLIAYAQKPTETRRRTLSEPTKPTAAVAGMCTMGGYGEAYRPGETQHCLPL